MQTIALPVDWRHFVAKADVWIKNGGELLERYGVSYAPRRIDLIVDGFPPSRFDAVVVYAMSGAPDERRFPIRAGLITADARIGLPLRFMSLLDGLRQGPFRDLEYLIVAYLTYARHRHVTDAPRWPAILSSSVLLEHWREHEAELRMLLVDP